MKTRMIILNCDFCGKQVRMSKGVYKWRMKAQEHIFCNRRCYERGKTFFALKEKSCTYCKKKIIRLKSQFKKKVQFCNQDCVRKFIREESEKHREMICPICRKKRLAFSPTDLANRKSHICAKCTRKYFDKENQEKLKIARKKRIELAGFKIFNCDWCRKEIRLSKKQKKAYKEHFCSKDCYLEWNSRRKVKGKCMNCQKETFKSLSATKIYRMNFCSYKCHYDYATQPLKMLKCINCNKNFTMKRSYYNQKIKGKVTFGFHCSRECFRELHKKKAFPLYYSRGLRALKISNKYARENNLIDYVELKASHLKFKEELRNAKSKEYQ